MIIPDDFPKTLPEFEARFSRDEQCRDFLDNLRWSNGFICPKCQSKDTWWWNCRGLRECKCGRQTSVTAGTVFHGSRKPLSFWFRVMFEMIASKSGIAAVTLMRLIGLSYSTAWTWLHKLRKAMVRPERPQLSGTVEVDESYFGGASEGKRGRGTNRPLVACAVELLEEATPQGKAPSRAPPTLLGRVRLEVIEDATQVSLTTFTCRNVQSGSIVVTDGLPSYLELEEAGFEHERRVIGKPKKAAKALPGVHRIFSLAKRWLLGIHQGAVSMKHLQAYLDEYVFRFNRRRSSDRPKLFHRLAEMAVRIAPTTYEALVADKLLEGTCHGYHH
jgi:transposase-like protein/Zn ribbon nucleic-acid-binding protein